MSGWINFNGTLREEGTALFTAGSRAFRYGDGVFETMRLTAGGIRHKALHFDRLFEAVNVLQLPLNALAGAAFLEKQILKTTARNRIKGDARIRLSVFRGEGGLYETEGPGGGYLIETWPLDTAEGINENGLVLGVYEAARKSCDGLSHLKSNNFLVYVMAALHSKSNRWNECIVLNEHHRVCDATIANIFWVKQGRLFTPPLSEGCVAGVMRRHLLESLPQKGFPVTEEPATVHTLEQADEIFLTNAISGLRWVKELNGKTFGNQVATQLYRSTF